MATFQLPRSPFAKHASLPAALPASRLAGPPITGRVLGVHVAGVLDLPIVQQPDGDDGYVSPLDGQITEFRMPAKYGNVGLLAHNELSGRFFSSLALGQDVHLLYGNGGIESFVVTDILRYQALQPESPYSSFRELGTRKTLTTSQLFEKIYLGCRHLTFQTCIAEQGRLTWGRLFVIAARKDQPASHRWN